MNRLAASTSPYLRQHAANPVDWYPWGPEALERARKEDRPIFLSIGYSACHWCHVMAHESFEDPKIAEILNAHFVSIKVDREERPDLDEVYMQAVMAMSGSGGWPMSVWLASDLRPFFGGTYFPPSDRWGRPGFRAVLLGIAQAWKEKRAEVLDGAAQLADAVRQATVPPAATGELARKPLEDAVRGLERLFDNDWGGFGGAPKFPPSMDLELLLREHRRTGRPEILQVAAATLDRMARGGMYDHLGGGFHRYSTDEEWRVPHFEKMLYDNALLARAYLHAWQATGKEAYASVVRETLDYVLREMTAPEGGFYSAQDADTEGEEGRFFAWTPAQVREVLGEADGARFCRTYDVTEKGNFEGGRNVLWLPLPAEDLLKDLKCRLFEARSARAKPGLDDKILADWNGLMIRAMAEAGAALGEARYVDAARKAADFCVTSLRDADRALLHVAGVPGFLDDHACLADGCLAVLQATGEGRWLMEALDLASRMKARFHDPEGGGFFFTDGAHGTPLARTKRPGDHATPSGNSVAVRVCLQLGRLTGDASWRALGEGTLRAFAPHFSRQPRGWAEMLCALDLALSEPLEIVVCGVKGDRDALLAAARRRFLPDALILPFNPEAPTAKGMAKAVPLLEAKGLVDGKPAAYVCRGGACRLPVTDPAGLASEVTR